MGRALTRFTATSLPPPTLSQTLPKQTFMRLLNNPKVFFSFCKTCWIRYLEFYKLKDRHTKVYQILNNSITISLLLRSETILFCEFIKDPTIILLRKFHLIIAELVFDCLVYVTALIGEKRFHKFRYVLEMYMERNFSASLAYR